MADISNLKIDESSHVERSNLRRVGIEISNDQM